MAASGTSFRVVGSTEGRHRTLWGHRSGTGVQDRSTPTVNHGRGHCSDTATCAVSAPDAMLPPWLVGTCPALRLRHGYRAALVYKGRTKWGSGSWD